MKCLSILLFHQHEQEIFCSASHQYFLVVISVLDFEHSRDYGVSNYCFNLQFFDGIFSCAYLPSEIFFGEVSTFVIKENKWEISFVFLLEEVTPSSVQRLLVALCSGISLVGLRRLFVVQGIEQRLVMLKASVLPHSVQANHFPLGLRL